MAVLCAEKKCRKYFSSTDDLLEHWSKRSSAAQAIPDHFHCKECVKLFDSKSAEEDHQTQAHSAFQSHLACPWCNWGCASLSSFVGHFELNHCLIVGKKRWQQMRKDKLAVSAELQKRHYGDDPDIINDPCEGVMGSRRPGAPPISGLSALRPPVSGTVRPNPVQLNAHDFPSLPGRAANPAHSGNAVPTKDSRWALNRNKNKAKALFPDAPAPTRPTPEQLAAATAPAVTKENLYADHDPENPNFNPHAYYEPVLEMFKCPHKFCLKKFKTPRQFKSHLDTVHKDPVRYQCPQCFRFLTSLHGLAAHIENPRAKCGVRRSREYGHLVSQLSCGLVELNRDFVLQEDRGFDDESYVDGSTAYGANSGSKRPAEFIMSSMGQKPKPAKLTPENLERVDELAHAVDQGLNFTEKTDEQLENERDMEENNGFW